MPNDIFSISLGEKVSGCQKVDNYSKARIVSPEGGTHSADHKTTEMRHALLRTAVFFFDSLFFLSNKICFLYFFLFFKNKGNRSDPLQGLI